MTLTIRSMTIMVVLLWSSCAKSPPASPPVVLYTDLDPVLVANVTAPFTKLTGIQVAVRPAEDPGLAAGGPQRIDVVLAADAAVLAAPAFSSQLQPLVSPVLDSNVPPEWRGPENRWVALAVNGVALIYHPERVGAAELQGLAQLAEPQWQGRLCLPRGGERSWIAAAAAVGAAVGLESLQVLAFGWYANAAIAPLAPELNAAMVVTGECDLTPAHSELFAKLQSENPDQPLRLHWPEPGALARAVAGGVFANAAQPEPALKLIEYLSTPEAQSELARLTRAYPINSRAEPPAQLATYGTPRFGDVPLVEILAQMPAAAEVLAAAAP